MLYIKNSGASSYSTVFCFPMRSGHCCPPESTSPHPPTSDERPQVREDSGPSKVSWTVGSGAEASWCSAWWSSRAAGQLSLGCSQHPAQPGPLLVFLVLVNGTNIPPGTQIEAILDTFLSDPGCSFFPTSLHWPGSSKTMLHRNSETPCFFLILNILMFYH